MAARDGFGRGPVYIGGLIAALVIVYFLWHQGYLSRGNGTLNPPTASPRLP